MSAICENGLWDDLKRRLADSPPGNDPQWPYFIGWLNQSVPVSLTVDGNWTGSYDKDGFTMSIEQNLGPDGTVVSSTFTFDYTEAEVDQKWAVATKHGDADTDYAVYLELE